MAAMRECLARAGNIEAAVFLAIARLSLRVGSPSPLIFAAVTGSDTLAAGKMDFIVA